MIPFLATAVTFFLTLAVIGFAFLALQRAAEALTRAVFWLTAPDPPDRKP